MKSRGEPVRANDVIAYVITGDGQDYNKNVAERAYSPQDVSKAGSDLTIGIGKQELELIGRLQLLSGETNSAPD
jgi:DNA polymerase alpha subunit A